MIVPSPSSDVTVGETAISPEPVFKQPYGHVRGDVAWQEFEVADRTWRISSAHGDFSVLSQIMQVQLFVHLSYGPFKLE